MGSSNSTGSDEIHFNSQDWIQDQQQSIQDIKNYTNMKNVHSGQIIHRYQVGLLSENDYHTYIQSLKWRKNQPFIVRVFHYQTQKQKQFCSTSYSVTVFLSTIKGRLSQFKDIPFPDNLYCMMAMLQGYNKLYDKIGRFYVCQQQVCIDQKGQIRVWLNNDLKKNFPQFQQYQQGNFLDDQSGMVDQILQMAINNTDQSQEPGLKFGQYYERQKFHRNNQIGFQEGKAIINDYARQNNVEIPNVFQSVLQMYQIQKFNQNNQHQHQDIDFLTNQINPDLPPINLQNRNTNQYINLSSVPNQYIQNKDTTQNYMSLPPLQNNPVQHINSNINLPINNRPIFNQPLSPSNNTGIIKQVRPNNYASTPPPPIHYSPVQYVPKSNKMQLTTPHQNQHPSPYNVQQRVLVKPINGFPTFSSVKNVDMNNFNQMQQNPGISSLVPTPYFYPSPQKHKLNPFQIIKGDQISKIINQNKSYPEVIRQNEYIHNYNNYPGSKQSQYIYQNNSEKQQIQYQTHKIFEQEHRNKSSEEEYYQHIQQDNNLIQKTEEGENLFDPLLEERKVTKSQAQYTYIQESQHQHNLGTKYSAPSSHIYQYQSGNMINVNKPNVTTNLTGLSKKPPKKAKLQYYYTVQEQQELDPQIAADLLLYT